MFLILSCSVFFSFYYAACLNTENVFPMVINTWPFKQATEKAWETVNEEGKTALDALVAGCSECEVLQCDYTVGYGGSPNENGETTLDALIVDGENQNVGAVAGLRKIKSAIKVARMVLEHTEHSILVGSEATKFAVNMGFKEENLTTEYSHQLWKKWKGDNCQPNYWKNVTPDPKQYCGPYKRTLVGESESTFHTDLKKRRLNHDTIGMVVIDKNRKMYAGTSTNGMIYKIPGRIGDGPIPGAGAYADSEVGAAAATGDGDVTLRYLPSFLAVRKMKDGLNPTMAAEYAMSIISPKYPLYKGAIVTVNKNGEFGAACLGMENFNFSIASNAYNGVTVKTILCL